MEKTNEQTNQDQEIVRELAKFTEIQKGYKAEVEEIKKSSADQEKK